MRKLLFGRKVWKGPFVLSLYVCPYVPKVALILVLASGQKSIFTRTCKKYRTLSLPLVLVCTDLLLIHLSNFFDHQLNFDTIHIGMYYFIIAISWFAVKKYEAQTIMKMMWASCKVMVVVVDKGSTLNRWCWCLRWHDIQHNNKIDIA